jgi:uncharacterized protein involved in exopolysaccharide biosynthesis
VISRWLALDTIDFLLSSAFPIYSRQLFQIIEPIMTNDNPNRPHPQPQKIVYAYPPAEFNGGADDEIDLRELWDVIWRGKWIITAVTAVFAVASVVYALSLPNIYQSEVLVAPSEESQGGGLAEMAGQLGGLASLAGINLGSGGGDNKVAIAMAVIKSRQFIADFVETHNILPELMAVESWDRSTNKLIFNLELYDQNEWLREVEPPKTPKPSNWEAHKAFMEILTVSADAKTGFVTIAIEHQSPYIAERWTTLLVEELNHVMKEQDVSEAQRSINFLNQQLERVALAEMRTVFYQLIEEQTKTIMLAEVRDEYIFSTIDPAVVAEEKAKPKRALICILGVMLGGMLAVMFVLIRHFIGAGTEERKEQADSGKVS